MMRQRISSSDRSTLVNNLSKLENIPATNRACRVVLVEKQWHKRLIDWLKKQYHPPPGPTATSALFINDEVDTSIIHGLDYEIVHHSIWDTLVGIFGDARAIVRHYVLNPSTNKPMVLLQALHLPVEVDGYVMRKSVAGNWLVKDVKRQLCEILQLSADAYSFCTNSTKLPESQSVSQVLAQYSGNWRLVSDNPGPDPDPVEAPAPKHVGLRNLGNTCFFNSAVQCLLRIPPLFEFALSANYPQRINPSNSKGSGGRIATAFRELAEQMCGPTLSINPSHLHSAICRKYPVFANWGQHDSQELLGALLDGLHEDLNEVRRPENLPPKADPWDCHTAKNSSPILDLFHGALASSIECPCCGHKVLVRDPFSVLSVPIPGRLKVSLESCLAAFARSEVLDDDNKWKCERCAQYVRATKATGVHKCARVLIIHLKRFGGAGCRAKKLATPVTYPDVLDTGICTGNANGAEYRLVGAVFHGGSLAGGHYTAAALDQDEGQWYSYNDSCASAIGSNGAHSDKAYILFYQKC
jgi:ubiquitin C-terminal hydrolase